VSGVVWCVVLSCVVCGVRLRGECCGRMCDVVW
jgi:hypothetical protein